MITSNLISTIDFSRPRVRFNGRSLSKFDLSSLIHEVAHACGNTMWPLCTDIYFDSYDYTFMRDELKKFVDRFNSLNH